MFSKILIANRGEIACRIIRTCRRLGVATVAVYSEADGDALHVRQADEAYLLGPAPAAESYLNGQRILEMARRSGAQAIHPGYGFLAENPRFVVACEEHGIQFIGPPAGVMERMGDKLLARGLAAEAGLPLVPGSDAAVNDEDALAVAREIGFPLMVKAAEGGGGIGMRIVNSPQDLLKAIERARFLVEAAFGSPRLYFEKYVEGASHVEVQILADTHGNAVHLFERDCSVQRRHQKVVEETPCVKIAQALRRQITEGALRLVRFIGYTNAGTVEFLVDRQGRHYFLEINTRLQVEHTITEMVTGLDLVEAQLRIAAGEPLPVRQDDIALQGHAIEARIYAEDPAYLTPAPGVVRRVEEPSGQGIRVDSAVFDGYAVTPYYDPLLAKLIVWGDTRDEAIGRLKGALDSYVVQGVETNIPVVQRVLAHHEFLDAFHSGSFLERLLAEPSGGSADKALAAAIAVAVAAAGGGGNRQRPSRWKIEGRRRLMLSRLNSGVP